MGKLEELEEELYGKDEEKLLKRSKRRGFMLSDRSSLPTSWASKKLKEEGVLIKNSSSRIFNFFWLGILVVFIVGVAVFVFFYLSTKGEEASLEILGQDRIEAGQLVTLPFSFRNTSRSVLREVELSVVLPEGSLLREEGVETRASQRILKKVEDLNPGEGRLVEIQARIFGREQEEKIVRASLLYRPESLRARFSVRSEKKITIAHVPLAVSLEMPEVLSGGQETELKISYVSNSDTDFENLYLRLEYPAGFAFKEGIPPPQIDNYLWRVGTLRAGEDGSLAVKGSVSGEDGEVKSFRAGLGTLNELTKEWDSFVEASRETKIAAMPLSVHGFLDKTRDKVINPGEPLVFTLRYKNNTDFTLRNVSLKAILRMGPEVNSGSGFLELGTISADKGGVFESTERSIIWGPSNLDDLREIRAGEGGEVSFSVNTKERPPVRGLQDRNLVVKLTSIIEAASVPPELSGVDLSSQDPLEFKVRSKVLFGGKALFRSSPIVNSGPLPPKVGEKTTYTVLWEVRNFTNDLKDAEVKTALPPNVKWENVISPKEARVLFDPASGEARWRIGDVKAGTGVLTPAFTAVFQVSVIPSEADLGKTMTLTNKSEFRFRDVFTGEERTEEASALSTDLREDPAVNHSDWQVVR